MLHSTVENAQGQAAAESPGEAASKVIAVHFHVALDNQAMIEGTEALQERITLANKIYEKTRLRFEIGKILPLPADIQELVSREDRNALAEKVPGPEMGIQVFLVRSARDVDKLNSWIAGVHWRYAGKQKVQATRRFIILSSMHSSRETLAHELGHWFGLNHEKDLANLMNGSGSRIDTLLTKDQVGILHANKDAAIKRKEIEGASELPPNSGAKATLTRRPNKTSHSNRH